MVLTLVMSSHEKVKLSHPSSTTEGSCVALEHVEKAERYALGAQREVRQCLEQNGKMLGQSGFHLQG